MKLGFQLTLSELELRIRLVFLRHLPAVDVVYRTLVRPWRPDCLVVEACESFFLARTFWVHVALSNLPVHLLLNLPQLSFIELRLLLDPFLLCLLPDSLSLFFFLAPSGQTPVTRVQTDLPQYVSSLRVPLSGFNTLATSDRLIHSCFVAIDDLVPDVRRYWIGEVS